MYGIPQESVVEVIMGARNFDQQTVLNTFHYMNGVTIADGDAALGELLQDFEVMVFNFYATLMSSEVLELFTRAQWVWPTRYRARERVNGFTEGQGGAPATPSGVSMVVRRFAEIAGKQYSGRIYVPGLASADVVDSQLADAFITANKADLEGTMTAELNTVTYGQFFPVIWHGGAPQFDDKRVRGAFLDPIVRYQRRREVHVGI